MSAATLATNILQPYCFCTLKNHESFLTRLHAQLSKIPTWVSSKHGSLLTTHAIQKYFLDTLCWKMQTCAVLVSLNMTHYFWECSKNIFTGCFDYVNLCQRSYSKLIWLYCFQLLWKTDRISVWVKGQSPQGLEGTSYQGSLKVMYEVNCCVLHNT